MAEPQRGRRAGEAFGATMLIAVPLLLLWMVWTQFGTPPPASLIWPEEEAEVIGLIQSGRGPGGRDPDLILELRLDDGLTGKVRTGARFLERLGRRVRRGEDGAPIPTVAVGDRLAVARGPGGQLTFDAPGDMLWTSIPMSLVALLVLGFGLRSAGRVLSGVPL